MERTSVPWGWFEYEQVNDEQYQGHFLDADPAGSLQQTSKGGRRKKRSIPAYAFGSSRVSLVLLQIPSPNRQDSFVRADVHYPESPEKFGRSDVHSPELPDSFF